jgi:putative SOS response-associated peptidase YedK
LARHPDIEKGFEMAERIAFELNGETRTVEVAPDTPLLYVLRNELGLSNPHFGCGLAQCGACTVHVDGAPTRSRAPIINFRSEGRRFPKGRCMIPASHFFEFTGAKPPKSKWKFTKAGEDWFCFAGLWRPMPDGSGDAFTLLTTEPGPEVAPIHNRQMVVLEDLVGT